MKKLLIETADRAARYVTGIANRQVVPLSVLPVLAPELTYSTLAIRNGASAALAWSELLSGELGAKESADLGGKLRAYCALDSYGMVAIWRALVGLVEG